jgi:hypothetical protein
MTVTLSSKGQAALTKQARLQQQLRPGAGFVYLIDGDSIILTPETRQFRGQKKEWRGCSEFTPHAVNQ